MAKKPEKPKRKAPLTKSELMSLRAKEAQAAADARVEPARRLVEQRERAFVSAWLRTRSAGKAWKVAFDPRDNHPKTDEALEKLGAEILASPRVSAMIDEKLCAAAKTLEVDAQRLILEWWDVATASPADMVQVRIHNCRYCHGIDHNYQWTGEAEWLRACVRVEMENEGRRSKRPMPSNAGGYGFRFTAQPSDSCPSCSGAGDPVLWLKDTRDYTDQERLLFDGVKQTKEGVEVKFRDRDAALQNIARILGLMTPVKDGKDVSPLDTFDRRGDNAVRNVPNDPQALARLYHDFIGEE